MQLPIPIDCKQALLQAMSTPHAVEHCNREAPHTIFLAVEQSPLPDTFYNNQ